MEYVKKDLGAYNLHLIKTDKFKTITVRIAFHSPVIKEEITLRNILCDMFLQSSKKYPSKRDLTIAAQDLYAADIQTYNSRLGNYNNLDIYLSVLHDRYTEEGNFRKALDFLNEIGIKARNIERCPSILYMKTDFEIKKVWDYLVNETELKKIDVDSCLHILNYIDIFMMNADKVEEGIIKLREKYGDNYLIQIGDNLEILNEIIL